MYRAGLSRSALRSPAASAATCKRNRSESARASPVSGGSAPAYEIPGIRIIKTSNPAARPSVATARRTLLQRVLELGDEIVDAFDADRQTHQAIVDAEARANLLRQRGVRHDRRVLDQALDAAQAFGEREEPAALQKPLRCRQAALQHR